MTPHDPDDLTATIDRLVDGELPEPARRGLLLGLDATPDGWRRCALAFLEAQGWRDAMRQAADVATPVILPRPAKRRVTPWLARAAVVAAAFGLGWGVRTPQRPDAPAVAIRKPTPPSPAPVRPAPAVAPIAPRRPAPANYARGLLERGGYHVQETPGFLPARTRDGRPVAVPVRRTTVRYVGNRAV